MNKKIFNAVGIHCQLNLSMTSNFLLSISLRLVFVNAGFFLVPPINSV